MSETYEQLITEISELTAELFNGRDFKRIVAAEDDEMPQIRTGSQRQLGGYDRTENYEIEATEQFVTVAEADGQYVGRHYLQLAWGNEEEDNMVTLDLDEGRLNDPYDETYSDEQAIHMARQVLYMLGFVRLDILETVPENDLSELEYYLGKAAIFSEIERTELGSIRIGAAATDNVAGFIARHELNGDEFPDDTYDRMVKRLCRKYGLTEAEVDEAIDLRMLEMEQAEQNSSGNQNTRK